ncbi:LuxR C-terminal-related transcriptional regulator [Parapedobacter sp. GCM10030251]|uniref:LuxR C-terminal-related transcriptional regulator n=1 Tax=Parapedobacter sp. GCM10030251 TaxID=3273419 RepID=UPI0036066AF4
MKSSTFFRIGVVFFSFFCSAFVVKAASEARSSSVVNNLKFKAIAGNQSLSVAQDTQGYTWIRGVIPQALLGRSVVFQIPSARIHDYKFYVSRDGKPTIIPSSTVNQSGFTNRSRFPQYEFIPNDSLYYVQLDNHVPQVITVQLRERHAFTQSESLQMLRIGLYYGLALMSLIFNLVFYLIFKDKRFVAYCTLLFFTFLSFLYEDGMFFYLSAGRWNMDYPTMLFSILTSIVSVPFTYYFLDLNTSFNRFKRVYVLISLLMLAASVVYVFTKSTIVYAIIYTSCFVFPLTCLYVAAKRFRTDVYARFLLLSLGFVMVIGLLYLLNTRIDSMAFSAFDITTFRLVSALEIISISFAIIFKARSLQHENERYRRELDNYFNALEIKEAESCRLKNGFVDIPAKNDMKKSMIDTLKNQYELTDREIEVLQCIWEGLTNKEIAERLCITLSTTKYHVSNLYLKMDAKNRNQVQVLQKSLWI